MQHFDYSLVAFFGQYTCIRQYTCMYIARWRLPKGSQNVTYWSFLFTGESL